MESYSPQKIIGGLVYTKKDFKEKFKGSNMVIRKEEKMTLNSELIVFQTVLELRITKI